MTIVNGILVFVILIVVLQVWLLTATLNAYLGGDTTIVVPAALASLGCLAAGSPDRPHPGHRRARCVERLRQHRAG